MVDYFKLVAWLFIIFGLFVIASVISRMIYKAMIWGLI